MHNYYYYDANANWFINNDYYDDGYYFVDGYCPVEKDGKWTFIDTIGNELFDFIFDDATQLSNGKAYVKYNGLWGILDVAKTVADSNVVARNGNTYYSYDEQGLKQYGFSINVRTNEVYNFTVYYYDDEGESLGYDSYDIDPDTEEQVLSEQDICYWKDDKYYCDTVVQYPDEIDWACTGCEAGKIALINREVYSSSSKDLLDLIESDGFCDGGSGDGPLRDVCIFDKGECVAHYSLQDGERYGNEPRPAYRNDTESYVDYCVGYRHNPFEPEINEVELGAVYGTIDYANKLFYQKLNEYNALDRFNNLEIPKERVRMEANAFNNNYVIVE